MDAGATHVAVIGSVGLPPKYGGWETLVDQLTRVLQGEFSFTVYCSAKKYPQRLVEWNGARLEYVGLDANGIQSIFYDLVSMLKATRTADVMLILGVSGCVFLPLVKLIARGRLIVNIDGFEWRRAKWGRAAKWFLKLSESVAVRFADVVVADNKAIQDYIVSEYGRSAVLIEYGGDHARSSSRALPETFPAIEKPYAFTVCRIEPENNLDMILEAFSGFPEMRLVIVGNWDNNEYGLALREKYRAVDGFHLLDPVYDPELLNCVRGSADLYIHGHGAGGTNPSLVEAMHLGLPIIAFGCAFNRETTEGAARYFDDANELVAVLRQLNPDDRAAIGEAMKSVADRRYTWRRISSEYAKLFVPDALSSATEDVRSEL
jgi:glycosyltransferase involved in cell wall biosynthesis